MRVTEQQLEIEIRNANGDATYMPCARVTNQDWFRPYVGVVATNAEGINDIDLKAIYVKNMDPNMY